MDELYERKKESDVMKLSTYKKLMSRIHNRIKVTSRQNNNIEYCWFTVPEMIFGAPKYDQASCIAYLMDNLKDNGFVVTYIHPNLLFISWNHWIPDYVRSEIKNKTGVVVDGFGNVVKKKEEKKEEKIINNKKSVNPFKATSSYEPSGTIYKNEFINLLKNNDI
jgi:hypothetical protein